MIPTALYIHLPFCVSKCSYCDFNSIVTHEELRERYLQALLKEIARTAAYHQDRVFTTVYFGGGTPTIYRPEQLCRILIQLYRSYHLSRDAEISCEANPGTVDAAGLAMMREVGFNRLSLGVQSLNDRELRLLGRIHDAAGARRAVAAARAGGFTNISLDLINALPGQILGQWEETLLKALSLRPQHLSCYGLMIEEGTPLAAQADAGSLEKIDEDRAVAIYEATHTICSSFGYEHYEISNFARPGCHCRHNETYWRNGEYVGIGAGACSYLSGYRLKYEPDPVKWTDRVLSGLPAALVEKEALDDEQRAGETLMLALRTAEGLDLATFCREFDLDPQRFTIRLAALVESGLALPVPGKLALDPLKGFLLQSEVAQMFM